jgi:hypothetical protein
MTDGAPSGKITLVGAHTTDHPDPGAEPSATRALTGTGSVSCAVCQCTVALTEDGTLTSCPGCGGRRFLSVSMFGTGAELIATDGRDIELIAGGRAEEAETIASSEQLRAVRNALEGPGDYLLFHEGACLQSLGLTREMTRIGRSLVADLRFEDPTVSRRHALILRELTGMRLLDDRSLYGVFVNGTRVSSRLLSDGDVIGLGRHKLLYQRIPTPMPPRGRRRFARPLPPVPRPARR